jgi:hypothetical protein
VSAGGRGSRLIRGRTPRVYVGPNAERSLEGEKGVLLGSRRAAWVDVLEFDPRPNVAIPRLVDLRFSRPGPWDIVGLSLSSSELAERGESLLGDLVPGDVVLTERGPLFHDGDRWRKAPLLRERARS